MKKSVLFCICCCLSFFSVYSKETHEFGILNPEDLELKGCHFEKDAPAVVLFDKGNARFIQTDQGYIIRFERHTRIKILNEAGFDQAEVEIALYKGKNNLEKLSKIEGFTYNQENGVLEKTPLDTKQVYQEEFNKYWYSKKFAMPRIKAGSIIEYKYVIESPYLFSLKDWEFQTNIPVLHSEYKVGMIPFYSYRYRIQGVSSLTRFNSYEKSGIGQTFRGIEFKEMIYEFVLKNVPSFQDEKYISSRNDYIKKIDFQMAEFNSPSGYTEKIMQTWPKLAKELYDSDKFGKYIKKASKIGQKEFAHWAVLPESERVDKVLNHVKKNYKQDHRHGKYVYHDLKTFQKEKTGNAANMNLLALGLLQGTGIKAYPVIISTRQHGKIVNDFPFLDQFNYVLILAEIDGKARLLDATDPFCPNTIIPSACINGSGFVVNEDEEQWITIANHTPSCEETFCEYSVSPDDYQLSGKCQIKYNGFKAVQERKYFYNDKKVYHDFFTKKNIELTNEIEVKHLHENDRPFVTSFSFKQDVDVIDNQIIINPFLNLPPKENWFKQEKRSLPVDLIYPKTYRFTAIIDIPAGYKVDVLPEKSFSNGDNLHFSYVAQTMNGNKIHFVGTFAFSKPTYPAEDYKKLKQFMNRVTQKFNEKIVLVKSEPIALK